MADEAQFMVDALLNKDPFSETKSDGPTVGLHLDIESLDVGPRSVVTQIGLFGVNLETQEQIGHTVLSYLPIQPQLDFIKPRTISANTLWWWMQQSDEARAEFEKSLGDDFGSVAVIMKHLTIAFNQMTRNATEDYIIIARGPQFDVVNIESLYRDCGMTAPWSIDPTGYQRIVDLRTLIREAGITKDEEKAMPKPPGFIAHRADWDARFASDMYFEARRRLRAS